MWVDGAWDDFLEGSKSQDFFNVVRSDLNYAATILFNVFFSLDSALLAF